MKTAITYLATAMTFFMLVPLSAEMTVLDDYSSSATITNYNGYDNYTGDPDRYLTWDASSGVLNSYVNPTIGNRYGGFQWNAGDTLDVGETVSVDIRLGSDYASKLNSTSMGLRLSPSAFGTALTAGTPNTVNTTIPTDSHFAFFYYDVDTTNPGFYFSTSSGVPPLPNKGTSSGAVALTQSEAPVDASAVFVTLYLTRGTGLTQDTITWSFGNYFASDSGTFTVAGVTETDPLYFGPDLYYPDPNYVFDNLSLGTIPESSSSTFVLGAMALALILGVKFRCRLGNKG